jgi:hypothetical protein
VDLWINNAGSNGRAVLCLQVVQVYEWAL